MNTSNTVKFAFYIGLCTLAAILMSLSMGCVTQRANEHVVKPDGTVHDRAWVSVDFYGPLGERTVTGLDIAETATTAHVKIAEQGQKSQMTLDQLMNVIGVLRGAPPLPATRPGGE